MIPYCSRNQRIASGLSGSPAEQTIRNFCGKRSPASSIAIIARIAVGVVNTFVTSWRERKSSCSAGSKPPSRWKTYWVAPSRHGPSSGEMPAAQAHSPMPWNALAVADVVAVDELLVGEDVAVGVDDALRHPGGAGRVVELRRVVGGGVLADVVGRAAGEQAVAVVEDEDLVDERGVEARRVGGVGDEQARLRVLEPVADAVVAVEDRHREQDRAELPGAEEDRRRLGRRREDDGDAVAALDAVLAEQVGGLVREVLELAPLELAGGAVEALPDHRPLLARVLVADVGGDVVALGHAPLVLGAGLLVGLDRGDGENLPGGGGRGGGVGGWGGGGKMGGEWGYSGVGRLEVL